MAILKLEAILGDLLSIRSRITMKVELGKRKNKNNMRFMIREYILRDRDPFPGIYILAQATRVYQKGQWL